MRTYVANNYRLQEDVENKPEGDDVSEGFTNNLSEIYQLSFLLTRDHEKAERCFVAGLDNYARGNRAFNQWAHSWARRIVIESAIQELKPRPPLDQPDSAATALPYLGQLSSSPNGHFDLDAILRLEDFERFVFVLSVLEHYSEPACAGFLECSVSEIREARTHVLGELVSSLRMSFQDN